MGKSLIQMFDSYGVAPQYYRDGTSIALKPPKTFGAIGA
jgi:hypothetical protein